MAKISKKGIMDELLYDKNYIYNNWGELVRRDLKIRRKYYNIVHQLARLGIRVIFEYPDGSRLPAVFEEKNE